MKALVVDDDIVSRMALMDLLSGFGAFELVEAEDGEAAWALLQAGLRPVICFCDVRMPRLSGIELLQRLRTVAGLGEMPFVLVSSAADRDTVLQAVKLGAAGYILKPFQVSEARAHLEKIFKSTLDKLAESPPATLKRLNIGPERLIAYLSAFHGQLETGIGDIAALLDADDEKGARQRLDTLHTGCVTLGIWHVASRLDLLRKDGLDGPLIAEVLAEVAAAVQRQSARVKAGATAAAPGAPGAAA